MSQDPKSSGIVIKNLFKVSVQIWNFRPLQSTPTVAGCSDPSAAPTVGNAAENLQWKYCQGPLAIVSEAQQHQRNTFFSNPASPVDTKQSHKEWGRVSRGVVVVVQSHHFVFCQKLLDAQGCVGGGIVMVQKPIPTLPLLWMFSS
jgi:hypothetical protein